MRITFFIDASHEFFCNWLEQFTQNAPYESFPTQKGRIGLQRAHLRSNFGSKSYYMVMDGYYIVQKDSDTETAYPSSEVIQFNVIPLTSSRVEIQAACNQPAVTKYFLVLLSEINKRWPQSDDVKTELLNIKKGFEAGLAEIKLGQAAAYAKIGEMERTSLSQILEAVQQGRIEQGETQNMLDAIRRTLKYIQNNGLPMNDPEAMEMLSDIYQSVNSNLDIQQQLELSLPIIPFLLQYKIDINAGVDLGAAWKEMTEHAKKSRGNT